MHLFCVILAAFICAPSIPQADKPLSHPIPRHGLHHTSPADVWDEALPLGNGLLGALV